MPAPDHVEPEETIMLACADGLGADRAAVRVYQEALVLLLELVGSNLHHKFNAAEEYRERHQKIAGHLS